MRQSYGAWKLLERMWANPYGSPMVVVYSRIRNANAACTGTVVYVVPSQYVRRNYFVIF